MLRVLLSVFLFSFICNVHGQKRQLSKIISEFNEGKFTEGYDRLLQIEKSEGEIPEVLFTRYVYYRNVKRTLNDLDTALLTLQAALNSLENVDEKEREKLCKEFGLCQVAKENLISDMEVLIFTSYTSSRSRQTILDFQKKYPNGKWAENARFLIDSLDYESIKNSRDLNELKDYILSHSKSPYNDDVQQRIYKNAFEAAKNSGSSNALDLFIKEYKSAPQLNQAQSMLEDIEWKSTLSSGTVKSFEMYAKRFPNSQYTTEANKKIEKLIWDDVSQRNTVTAYKEYLASYPNSEFSKEALKRYDAMRDNVFPFLLRDKKYALYDIDSKTFRSQEVYESLSMIDGGKFIASKYKKFGVVDKNGEVIIPLTYNCISSVEDMLQLQLGNKYALFKNDGQKIIDFQYDQLYLEKSLIKAIKKGDSDTAKAQYDIYDKAGVLKFSGQFHNISIINDTLFIATLNSNQFLINSKSKIISSRYQSIGYPQNDMIIVNSFQKYGVINTRGIVVLPAQYEFVYSFDSSSFFVIKNKLGQQGLINASGVFLINFQSKDISGLNEGMFLLQTLSADGGYADDGVLYNAKKRNYVVGEKYTWVNSFLNGYALAGKKDKCGYIDITGKWVVPPLYDESMRYYGEGGEGDGGMPDSEYFDEVNDEVTSCYSPINSKNTSTYYNYYPVDFSPAFIDGLALVQIDGLYGYVNTNGELKIPIIYAYAENFHQGLANVKIDEGGNMVPKIIDKSGKVVFNNSSLMYFYDQNKKALLLQGEDYVTLDLTSFQARKLKLKPGYEYLTPMPDYFVGSFKEEEVIVLSNGVELMDPQIDFSEYDFKKKVYEVNQIYYSGEYDKAIAGYMRLLNIRPRSYTLNYMLALCYQEKKDNYNYKNYLDKAIDIRPNDMEIKMRRVEYNYENKYWRDVVSDLNVIIPTYTYFDPSLYFKRAYANSNIGYENEAFDDYSSIISNSKASPMAYNNRGVIYLNRRQYAQALSDFNSAILNSDKSDTENQGLYYANKGNTLLGLNRKSEACSAWEKALGFGRSGVSSMISRYCR